MIRARRLLDALALNLAAAIAFHLLTLLCRAVEARRQIRRPLTIDVWPR